ncbi:MAG: T9SS type A sorting domain-containing protein [Bacteroidetes bacterium]|nr:T9SS type A sorting domain-containing protein [Bacteroidota bacterium]
MVKDIRTGTISSNSGSFYPFNNKVCVDADDGINGTEPWVSDGTVTGTFMLTDVYSGSSSGAPFFLSNVSNKLYLKANNNTNGTELWKTDGTTAGTVLVKDINPGSVSGCCGEGITVNGIYYFPAIDISQFNQELWKSNGTVAGTIKLAEIYPGNGGSNPHNFNVSGDYLYFVANDSTHGDELYAAKISNTLPIPLLPSQQKLNDEQNENITVHPTVSEGIYSLNLTSSSNEKLLIRVTNITGQIILSKEIMESHYDSNEINISDYSNGVYMVTIHSSEKIYVFKILKI